MFGRTATREKDVLDALTDALSKRKRQERDPFPFRAAEWLMRRAFTLVSEHVWPRIPIAGRVALGAIVGAPVLTSALHNGAPRTWPLMLPVAGALACAAWMRLRPTGALGFGPVALPSRALLPGAVLAAGVWLTLAWAMGLSAPLLFALPLTVGPAPLLLLARPRQRVRKRTERDPSEIVRDWESLTAPPSPVAKALAGSRAEVWARDEVSWTIRVELAAGHTADEIVALARNVESAFRIRLGSLRVSHDDMAHRVLLRAVSRDLLSKPTRWQEPEHESVLDPILLGTFEDGQPAELRVLPEPGRGIGVVLAGLPGAGKSGVVNVVVAGLMGCRDVALAGIDAQGTELGPWEDGFEPGLLALDGGPDAKRVLDRLIAIMAARQQWLRQHGVRWWTPSPELPEIVLICDEAADLAPYMEKLDILARKGRKTGIHVVLATQRPSAQSLGEWGKEMLAKLGAAICLQVSTVTEVNVVLGPGAAGEGWRADQLLTRPGEFLIRGGEHKAVRRARSFLVSDDDVRRWVAACRARRPRLDEASAAACAGVEG